MDASKALLTFATTVVAEVLATVGDTRRNRTIRATLAPGVSTPASTMVGWLSGASSRDGPPPRGPGASMGIMGMQTPSCEGAGKEGWLNGIGGGGQGSTAARPSGSRSGGGTGGGGGSELSR